MQNTDLDFFNSKVLHNFIQKSKPLRCYHFVSTKENSVILGSLI